MKSKPGLGAQAVKRLLVVGEKPVIKQTLNKYKEGVHKKVIWAVPREL